MKLLRLIFHLNILAGICVEIVEFCSSIISNLLKVLVGYIAAMDTTTTGRDETVGVIASSSNL